MFKKLSQDTQVGGGMIVIKGKQPPQNGNNCNITTIDLRERSFKVINYKSYSISVVPY